MGLLVLLLLTAVYGQDKAADNPVNIEEFTAAIKESALFQKGLFETIPPPLPDRKPFLPLKTPSADEVSKFQEIADTDFQATEQLNFKLKDIDTDNKDTPVFGPHLLTDQESLKIHETGVKADSVTAAILESVREATKGSLIDSTARFAIFDLVGKLDFRVPKCPFETNIECDGSYSYRTIDGSCNNLNNPYWGKSFTPFERFLAPQYQGTSDPRSFGHQSLPLPGPREISLLVHEASNVGDLDPQISYMLMQWGQFTDHDISFTPKSKGYDGLNLECCQTGLIPRRDCFPIFIPANDPYYQPNKTCLGFVRSTSTPALDCSTGFRQQLNELTHFIDASNVYGSTASELASLRDGITEMMNTSTSNMLPLDFSNNSGCQSGGGNVCFLAGDKRSNVQPGLSSMHTIFVREHNRIASIIKADNPLWSDEQVFQEARRFVSAEMQQITYANYLPKLLNNFFRTIFDLNPRSQGNYFTGYDPNVKPMIRNAFATAIYRFGHSLLRDTFQWGNTFPFLHTQFNNPDLLYPVLGIEKCTQGLYDRVSQGLDEKLTPEVTNKLFKTMADLGGDLASFNIQRGRDHGLPPYNDWLQACYGITANTFQPGVVGGLLFHDAYVAGKLDAAYDHPNDIDLFTGAVSEKHLPGALLGPTMACVLSLQFRALKYGDRFFFEGNTQQNPHPFTMPQLDSIRQRTLAKIICDNTAITTIPMDVFLKPNPITNPYVTCSELPDLELPCTPINGGWTSWTSSRPNICTEYRFCTNPKPNRCGQYCIGPSTRSICILSPPPDDNPAKIDA